jgi:hypothetical protein
MDRLQVALSVAAEGTVVAAGLLAVRSTTEVVTDVAHFAERTERAGTRARVTLRTSVSGRITSIRGLVAIRRAGTTGDKQDGNHQTCCYCEYCDESLHSDHPSGWSLARGEQPLTVAEPHLADTNAAPD